MIYWPAILGALAITISPVQTVDPLLATLPGQLVPESQSFTVCPDGASAFRMMRDGYHAGPNILNIDRFFSALRANRCEQLSGPALVLNVVQVRRIVYASDKESAYALIQAEDGNGRAVFGIYEPSLSITSPVTSQLELARDHTDNGFIGGPDHTYYVCPDLSAARRVVRNIAARDIAPEEERLANFERNLESEGCDVSSLMAELTDAFEFAGFQTGDTMGGMGAYSAEAELPNGKRVALVLPVSF